MRFFLLLCLVIILLIIFNQDLESLSLLENINLSLLSIAILLSITNIGLDFFIWYFYLSLSDDPKPIKKSLAIFLSGFATDILPARIGTFSRAYFLNQTFQVPYSKGVSIQLVIMLADLLAAFMIGIVGINRLGLSHDTLFWVLGFSLSILLSFIFIRYTHIIGILMKKVLMKFIPSDMNQNISALKRETYQLLSSRYFIIGLVIKSISWLLMATTLYHVLSAFSVQINMTPLIFVVTLSAILGLLSMLPWGGIGVTDASLISFLIYLNVPLEVSTVSVLIYRFLVLWLWLFIGNFVCQLTIKSS